MCALRISICWPPWRRDIGRIPCQSSSPGLQILQSVLISLLGVCAGQPVEYLTHKLVDEFSFRRSWRYAGPQNRPWRRSSISSCLRSPMSQAPRPRGILQQRLAAARICRDPEERGCRAGFLLTEERVARNHPHVPCAVLVFVISIRRGRPSCDVRRSRATEILNLKSNPASSLRELSFCRTISRAYVLLGRTGRWLPCKALPHEDLSQSCRERNGRGISHRLGYRNA